MTRRRPKSRDQQGAHKGSLDEADCRRRAPLLSRLIQSELRAVPGATGTGGAGVSGDGGGWWQPSGGRRSAAPRLPSLSALAPHEEPSAAALTSLLLPPLVPGCAPRRPATPRQDPPRSAARAAPDSLGSLLGEFLPPKFREFLSQLGVECVERPQSPTSPAAQHQRGLSGYCQSSQCPSCSFLPEQRGQSSHFQKGLEKILLHQIPTLGPQRSDQLQFKRNNHLGTQTPKGQALQTHRSSGEGAEARPRRRYCPFRVRFADETLRDTALRYWERSCAAQQCIAENENATRPFRELQDILSENTSMNSNLTCTPRAASQSQRGGLKAFLETNGILDQAGKPPTWGRKLESFLPRLVLNSVLKRGRPKGYQLLLPPTTWQQAQR